MSRINSDEAAIMEVIYTAGRVFDNLQSTREGALEFLRSGSTAGVKSKADLDLLADLRDAAEYVLAHPVKELSADYLMAINSRITRSGALNPGSLRTAEQNIGVSTRYGRHEPLALTDTELDALLAGLAGAFEGQEDLAITTFVHAARAQPFEDGNKRTALFAANSILIGHGSAYLLTVPYSDDDIEISRTFSDNLAKAYLFEGHEPVTTDLKERGLALRD